MVVSSVDSDGDARDAPSHGTERSDLPMRPQCTTFPLRLLSESRRFWAKVQKTSTCWLWTGAINSHGYGSFVVGSKAQGGQKWMPAHRWAYEAEVGIVPVGLQLDHLCRNRACVNPEHLRVTTRRDNILCGESFSARNARKTHCPKGHPYDLVNTWYWRGWRKCRACDVQKNQQRKEQQRVSA